MLVPSPASPVKVSVVGERADRPPEKPGGKWRGVSLGGWLLMEPGPAKELFRRFPDEQGHEARCEWELMENLRRTTGGLDALREHRETHITIEDFRKIRAMGLNAVRIPFGYWAITGPSRDDPYEGPAMEYLDRAMDWAEECGLQVLLDLHGCPGGESGEAPCGRRQRPPQSTWQWRRWRFSETLRIINIVAERYQGRRCVTGFAVCNEPSPEVPSDVLSRFYDRAVKTVRNAGMGALRVSIVLPVFQRSLEKFVGQWELQLQGRVHENICFEVHWYHCFENHWHGLTFAQHLRAVQSHAEELRRYPLVVGEWSLALGCGAQPGKVSKEGMRALFAQAQLAAYDEASYGWFFWTWNDQHGIDWDWRESYAAGYLKLNETAGDLVEIPPRSPTDEDDPLELLFDSPACDPMVRMGDTVYLRAFNGRYLDVEGSTVRARYGDRGKWQQFTLCPCESSQASAETVQDGDVVCLLSHNGRYLGVYGETVEARERRMAAQCVFVAHVDSSSPEARHRSPIFLQSLTTSKVLAPNEGGSGGQDRIVARWSDFGEWQRLVLEKPLSTVVTPRRPRRRSSFPGLVTPVGQGRRLSGSSGTASVRRRASSSTGNEAAPSTPLRKRRKSAPTTRSDGSDGSRFASPVKRRRASRSDELKRPTTPVCKSSRGAACVGATPLQLRCGFPLALHGTPATARSRRSSAAAARLVVAAC
mmetsp:Transcript_11093/g.31917  ORF Transcript_11093/g.31917 Transcript_11093/m.31917 type:complete len:704 (-) Transcript_11093:66-2177(-)